MLPRIVISVSLAALAVSLPLSAHAEPAQASSGELDLHGWTDTAGVGAQAAVRESVTRVRQVPRRTTRPACSSSTVPPDGVLFLEHFALLGLTGLQRGTEPGRWLIRRCVDPERGETSDVRWAAPPASRTAPPIALARQALGYAPLALPAIGISPAANLDQLVNVPTWLWIDPAAWVPTSTNASAGGVTVTTTATPQRVKWETGDGDQVSCDGPGTAYDPTRPDAEPGCSHTYRRPAPQVVLTATIEWSARWTTSGGDGGDLGVVRRSASVPLRVAEAQAINTQP